MGGLGGVGGGGSALHLNVTLMETRVDGLGVVWLGDLETEWVGRGGMHWVR